ncbi:mitochondrial mRNA pseudouridine synthase RPUSD3-like [Bacillus rossius redtenbacheri]|uniref:mitochondrial mRNA pseudouridine synthase RPUSD3-like n=1 Tax=Bacillus rossius redtenbacheri TaxID=93214 RepID=UPI002FDDAB08
MKKQCHPYYLKNNLSSLNSIVSFIIKNVLYNKDGLVVFNKPYGILQKPSHQSKGGVTKSTLNTAAVGDSSYSLQEVLPFVAQALKCPSLQIVKTPERYESGVGVLASSEVVADKVRQSLRRAKPLQRPSSTYWGVVIGTPQPESARNKFGMKLKPMPGGDKQVVLTRDWSRLSVRRGEVKLASVCHRTLCRDAGGLAGLVEVATTSTKWHFVRLYLSYLLSPLLGDNLLGSRVAEVLGQKVLLPPGNDAARLPQKLNGELMSALRLQPGWEAMVPAHLHLHQLTLIGFQGKGKDLVLEAPVPEVFRQTCDWLGLELPGDEDLQSRTVSSRNDVAHG